MNSSVCYHVFWLFNESCACVEMKCNRFMLTSDRIVMYLLTACSIPQWLQGYLPVCACTQA
uniref:Uncharacterized protein n=1 Tax=Cannabis sativa TaxID=3483 RepID=A0A803QWD0_CANSA